MNIYNHPVDQFVFSFIGLSNFIPVEISDGKVNVEGAREWFPFGKLGEVKDKKMTLLPSEIGVEVEKR